jgi:hypothetical protein
VLLKEGVHEFVRVHLYFGFILGAESCDFFSYGWHLKVSVQNMVRYVPWCVGHHSEDFVL